MISGFTPIGNDATAFPSFYHDPSWTFSTNVAAGRRAYAEVRHPHDRFAMNHWQPEVGAGARGVRVRRRTHGGARTDRRSPTTYAAFLGLTSLPRRSSGRR